MKDIGRIPVFSKTERTAAQRRESVQWAAGVTASQGSHISPALRDLYRRYVAGEIDIRYIDAELDRLYPQVPSDDPRYAPGQPTNRYYPEG